MVELIPGIRNAVRAVIARDGALLVQEKVYETGQVRYALPGGAPNLGETLETGLQRECLEEIGISVEVVELMHVADYHKLRDSDPPTKRQQVEFLFRCRVPDSYVAMNGPKPDKHQTNVLWLPFGKLADSPMFPTSLTTILVPDIPVGQIYLGLIQ